MSSGPTSSPPDAVQIKKEGGAQTSSSQLSSGGFDGPMANVYVGPEAKQWTIHLEMFARYSPLFRHFCNQAKNKRAAQVADHQQPTEAQDGTAKEGAPAADMSSTEPANEGTSTPSKKARLSDTFTIEIRQPQWRPAVFGLLVHWVYASDLLRTSSFPKGRRGLEAPKVMDFIDLHIMGLELKMTSLCNAAIGEIYDQLKPVEGKAPRHPKPVEILRVFKNTPADSGLRKLMTVHALLYIFSERRNKHLGLPEGWEPLVKSSSEVGWALLSMVSTWDWVAGRNTNPVTVKPKEAFFMVDAVLDSGL